MGTRRSSAVSGKAGRAARVSIPGRVGLGRNQHPDAPDVVEQLQRPARRYRDGYRGVLRSSSSLRLRW